MLPGVADVLRPPGGVDVSRWGGPAVVGLGLPGRCICACWGIIAAFALSSAFSIGRTRSREKTGRVSIDPTTGCFHVLSISSILLRVALSTTVYASIKVLKMFRPR